LALLDIGPQIRGWDGFLVIYREQQTFFVSGAYANVENDLFQRMMVWKPGIGVMVVINLSPDFRARLAIYQKIIGEFFNEQWPKVH
jgi:hypothetical protein